MPISGKSAKEFLERRGCPDTPCYSHFGAGWHKILDKLLTELKAHNVNLKYDVHQIKEKFGGLRVYLAHHVMTDPIKRLIQEAEDEAARTCDICGEPGVCMSDRRMDGMAHTGWMRTRCEKHPNTTDDRWSENLRRA